MRKPRQIAESNIYHVIARGAGRQIIFEDNIDRFRYLKDLDRFTIEQDVCILAWCLLSNHLHLLLEGDLRFISILMRTLCSEYAQYFNMRHERVGPLFQGRYKSEPVESDDYLINVVRYIHNNPMKAGIATTESYRWSSYEEYISGSIRCKTDRIMGILGSKEQFIKIHQDASSISCHYVMNLESTRNFDDSSLIEWAIGLLGDKDLRSIKELPKELRDQKIRILRNDGMSIRQIERITGIGRSIISRA